MLTRRGFFGTVAALVVGGGAAQLRLAAPVYGWEQVGPWSYRYAFFDAGSGKLTPIETPWLTRVPRRDDGDTILELAMNKPRVMTTEAWVLRP